MAILSSSAFPNAPAPMLPLAFATAAKPSIEEDASALSARFSISRNLVLSDLVAIDAHFPSSLDVLFADSWGLADYHEFVDAVGRSWHDRIPSWAASGNEQYPSQAHINATGRLSGGGGEGHFDDPGAYGFMGVLALRRLFDFGVGADRAADAVRQVAARGFNPNTTIGTTPSVASLNDWFITLELPLVEPGVGSFDDVEVSNILARYIIGSKPVTAHHFEYFHENVIADIQRFQGTGLWKWEYVRNLSSADLDRLSQDHQWWKTAWENLFNRTDRITTDNAKDIVTILWRKGLLVPTSVPITPLDDISLLLINNGIWGPLFPDPNASDWNDPVENTAVISRMVQDLTGIVITPDQVSRLLVLHAVTSVPASLLALLRSDEAERYRQIAVTSGDAFVTLFQRAEIGDFGTALDYVARFFRAGVMPDAFISMNLAEVDSKILSLNLGVPVLLPRSSSPGESQDWFVPISDNAVVAAVINLYIGPVLTTVDVGELLRIFNTPTPTFAQIRAVYSNVNESYQFIFGEPPPIPSIPDLHNEAAVGAAVQAEIERVLYFVGRAQVAGALGEHHSLYLTIGPIGWRQLSLRFAEMMNEIAYVRNVFLPQLRMIHPHRVLDIDSFDEWLFTQHEYISRAFAVADARANGRVPGTNWFRA